MFSAVRMEKGSANDSAMLLVANRLGTFSMWPFKEEEGSTCTPARSAATTVEMWKKLSDSNFQDG